MCHYDVSGGQAATAGNLAAAARPPASRYPDIQHIRHIRLIQIAWISGISRYPAYPDILITGIYDMIFGRYLAYPDIQHISRYPEHPEYPDIHISSISRYPTYLEYPDIREYLYIRHIKIFVISRYPTYLDIWIFFPSLFWKPFPAAHKQLWNRIP